MTNDTPRSSDRLTDALRDSYDALPYDNLPRWTTHPDCLATAAHLHGLTVPPVPSARVLELGCSTGVNLIALAMALPEGRYTGLDLSATQVGAARALAGALGLEQVRFEAADLRAVSGRLGEFDYILCHGVYSHVPPDVQEAILATCARSLSPMGVACVSYNTHPGWYLRGMIRDLLRRRVRDLPPGTPQVSAAREFLRLLAGHASPPGGHYRAVLEHEQRLLVDSTDTYIVHEHLDPVNDPLYLTDFVARARRHGLEYVGDAEPEPLPGDLPDELGSVVSGLAEDGLERDQLLDILRGRAFRSTVLCRAESKRRPLTAVDAVADLVVRARAIPESDQPEVQGIRMERFKTRDERIVETNDPLVKALLLALYRRAPRTVEVPTLVEDVRSLLAGALPEGLRAGNQASVAEALLRFHRGQVLRLQTSTVPFATTAGARPVASALARAQAGTGATVTTLRHDNLRLDDTERSLLQLLDGTRDRQALLERCPGLNAAQLDVLLQRMATHALLRA